MVEPITRMIYLQDEINNETLSDVISAILLFNKADDMEKAKLRNPIISIPSVAVLQICGA